MNCVKCPITDECKVGKMSVMSDCIEQVFIPTRVMPYQPEDCLFIKLLIAVEELKALEEAKE